MSMWSKTKEKISAFMQRFLVPVLLIVVGAGTFFLLKDDEQKTAEFQQEDNLKKNDLVSQKDIDSVLSEGQFKVEHMSRAFNHHKVYRKRAQDNYYTIDRTSYLVSRNDSLFEFSDVREINNRDVTRNISVPAFTGIVLNRK